MDGNGRWATGRGLPRHQGHRAGTNNIRPVLEEFVRYGVKYLTLFAFSTENWERPDTEVDFLMELLQDSIISETQGLHKNGVRICHFGRREDLSVELQKAINGSVDLTKDNKVITLNIAYNYGGRAEIVDAVKAIIDEGIESSGVTEDVIRKYLYSGDIPDPDLIIRTAGEMRISNFLIWQTAYSEYYYTSVLWPNFDENEVRKAMDDYSSRSRRYGRV
jgi:undecaprenyl diphosphate synthase